MKKLSLAVAVLGLAAVVGARAEVPVSLLGDTVPVSEAHRTIVITPSTKWVNVTEGETVKFVANGQEFAFDFDSVAISSFDLQRIAPAGALDHKVPVYVAANLEVLE